MQALHEPVNVEVSDTVAVVKRARSSSPPLELSPAKKRPFTAVDKTSVIDWAPSPSAMTEEEKDVTGGDNERTKDVVEPAQPGESVKKAKGTKGKGKGKEKAILGEAMVQD